MIPRPDALEHVRATMRLFPITAILGPRQCGKTTLARWVATQEPSEFYDLENPVDRERLRAPMQTLSPARGLVIIDEVQRQPELFELLRVLVDRPGNPLRLLLLGSASPSLVRGASESLAGRIGFVDLHGFNLWEVGSVHQQQLWLRGGFPRSFLAPDDAASARWLFEFTRMFLERDVPQLGITVPAETLRRFWTMLAHYHGQVWNAATLARSMGASEGTMRRYLDILAGAFMVRVLPPWFENLSKRQVKAPKLYLRDSGLLHSLLQLESMRALLGHPKLGASWEGFAIEQILSRVGARDAYFWATHAGAELDLLVLVGGRRFGFEIKYADAPSKTRSMAVAVADLRLEHLWVVYPGQQAYALDEKISVLPLEHVSSLHLGAALP